MSAEINRLAPALRPSGRVVMRPTWSRLLFLHWDFAPEIVQQRLPPGLEVDTFEGRAYVGLVPFAMGNVRPHFLPKLGRFAFYERFPELNVRTYVVRDGVPGVWFFSLDAGDALAVLTARAWFKLPYFKARLRERRLSNGATRYISNRRWPRPLPASCDVTCRVEGDALPAEVGSLEHFLVERYVLFSRRGDAYFRGRVHHAPYELQMVLVESLRESCLRAADFARPNCEPHAVYASGVNVEVFGLERC